MRNCYRTLAHANMEREGIRRINKPNNKYLKHASPSFFARNWQKYAFTPARAASACAKQLAEDERRRKIRAERRASV